MNHEQLTSNLQIALSYLKKKLSVMPLWSPEMIKNNPERFNGKLEAELKKNDESENPLPKEEVFQRVLSDLCKAPLLSTWKRYQTELPTVEEVTEWFTKYPNANIAIITGKVSGIIVFDVDSEKGTEYAKARGGFPKTPCTKTGGGFHYFMKHPGNDRIKNSANHDLTIDIRGDGGYVVAPPSIHGSGTQYQWQEQASIFDLEPAECTSWMLDYLNGNDEYRETKEEHNADNIPKNGGDGQDRNEHKLSWAEILMKECSLGTRNQTATELIGHLFKKNLDEDEIWAIAVTWNRNHNPPMDLRELKKTFESVKRSELESRLKGIELESLLDTPQRVAKEYEENYVRVKFGGDNLSLLERKMEGGLIGGRLYILGGIPTSGKTALLNNIADNICLNNHPVLVFSYDDGQAELRYRTFSRICKIPIKSFNSKSHSKIEDLCNHAEIKKIMGLKYVVEKMLPIEEWGKLVDHVRRKTGHPPVILIDYLRKLRTHRKFNDERLRIEFIVSSLTDLAKAYNIPIVAISELARDSYKTEQKLSMASFKETGMIEYEASWLGILAPVEEAEDGGYQVKTDWDKIIRYDGDIDLIIFKAKRGTGDAGRMPLKVDKKYMTVMDRQQDPIKTSNKPSKFD